MCYLSSDNDIADKQESGVDSANQIGDNDQTETKVENKQADPDDDLDTAETGGKGDGERLSLF